MHTKSQISDIVDRVAAGMSKMFGDRLKSVILYGSCARGDYNNESDIDIMVLVDIDKYELIKYRRSVISFLRPIEFEQEILISVHLQDIETFNNWRHDLPFYMNVIKVGTL